VQYALLHHHLVYDIHPQLRPPSPHTRITHTIEGVSQLAIRRLNQKIKPRILQRPLQPHLGALAACIGIPGFRPARLQGWHPCMEYEAYQRNLW
jgi:hypothetical protein